MRYGGLILAIVCAAIAAVVVLRMSGGESQPTAQAPAQQDIRSVNIYTAKDRIPIGTVITKEMIAVQPWPEHLVLPGFIVIKDGVAPLDGMVARSAFQQNEPIISSKLANPNDPSFLAGELPAGMRVVTLPMNEVDSVAGFVYPGDRVDVIYTHDVPKVEYVQDDNSLGERRRMVTTETVSETILTNVKVLAVDQIASGANVDNKGNLRVPRSASVMVSQADAQRVRLAQKTGSVSMALRALVDKDTVDPLIYTGTKDVTQNVGEASASGDNIKIMRGAPAPTKESVAAGVTTQRGAPNTPASMQSVQNPVTSVPSGNVVNPALVAVP